MAERSQIVRMLQLLLAVRGRRFPDARELADHCEVSRRTIYRDLQTLALAGVPLHYRVDVQGYELDPSFVYTAPRIEERDLAALLVAARDGSAQLGIDFRRRVNNVIDALLQGMPDEPRGRLATLAEVICGTASHSEPRDHQRAELDAQILDALARRRQVRIWFQQPDGPGELVTKFSPYRLLVDRGDWTLIGRSALHRKVRSLRVSWITKIELTAEPSRVPPRFAVDKFLGDAGEL